MTVNVHPAITARDLLERYNPYATVRPLLEVLRDYAEASSPNANEIVGKIALKYGRLTDEQKRLVEDYWEASEKWNPVPFMRYRPNDWETPGWQSVPLPFSPRVYCRLRGLTRNETYNWRTCVIKIVDAVPELEPLFGAELVAEWREDSRRNWRPLDRKARARRNVKRRERYAQRKSKPV